MKSLASFVAASAAVLVLVSSAEGGMTASVPNRSTSAYGTNYHIEQGRNYPDDNPTILFGGSSLTKTARFDETAIYQTKAAANQADINKLYGFSDCYSHHQTNSARFGWRYYGGKIELHAYAYRAGVRSSKLVSTILPYEQQKLTIKMSGSQYVFYVNGLEKARLSRGCAYVPFTGYQLLPYFGGDETAPHDIDVKLQ